MTPAKIDIKLEAYLTQAVDTTANLQITHPVGLSVAAAAHWLMDETLTSYKTARAKVKQKRRDAKRAASQLAHVESRATDLFSLTVNDLHARKWELRNGPPGPSERFESDVTEALGGTSPSAFSSMGIDRKIETMDSMAELSEDVFGPSYARASEARVIHAELKTARTVSVTAVSELRLAMTELKASRVHSRRNYSAARRMVSAALELEDYDDIFSVMRPLNSIYRSTKQGDSDEKDADMEEVDEVEGRNEADQVSEAEPMREVQEEATAESV